MQLTRFHYGMAASIAALVVAAPLAMRSMRDARPLAVAQNEPAAPPPVAAQRQRGFDETVAQLPRASTPDQDKRQIAARDAVVDMQRREAAQKQVAEAQQRQDAKDTGDKGKSEAGALAKTDADKKAKPSGVLPHAQERPAEPVAAASPPVSLSAVPPAPPQAGIAAPLPSAAIAPAKPATPERGVHQAGQAIGRIGQLQSAPTEQRTATLMPPPHADPAPSQIEQNRDQFQSAPDNPVKQVAQEPVSTFSIDVDTASYSFARRALNSGRLPAKDAVRVEEMINYFPYDYTRPESAEVPFQPNISVFPAPWNSAHKIVHIGLKGYELQSAERPRANIVLLIDTSGSMQPQDRLPLLKNAFRMLVDELRPDDTVSIVTYAGDTRVALEPTKVADKARIVSAIGSLSAGGGTYGEGGIKKAYEMAEASFDPKGVNRIVLGTDGDFNIGISNRDELKGYIERKREKGVFLSIVGVGRGNYNDALMQSLAQNGNGAAAYVDTLSEARKVLVEEASSTLFPIAKDVKIQVEFNPAVVSEYRLIGYETRMLKREDFNNDKVDAGDVGSGHTITAIYEVTPVDAAQAVDPLRYGAPSSGTSEPQRRVGNDTRQAGPDTSNELGFFKLRYKLPKEDTSRLLTLAIGPQQTKATIAEAPAEARFSAAVAAFGQLLRGSPYLAGYNYDDVLALAQGARGEDRFGYRAEFLNLVRLAKSATR